MIRHTIWASIRRTGIAGFLAVVLSCIGLSAESLHASPDSSVRPSCAGGCPIPHALGTPHDSTTGTIATPIGTTYSVHHMVGADLDQDGNIDCRFIYDLQLPGEPDDIVTYDAVAETTRTDVMGNIPTVTESKTDNANGTHLLVIDTSASPGWELFPGGIVDQGASALLTDACFMIGVEDPLDWDGLDVVTSATVSFLSSGSVVSGPHVVSGPDYFTVPWNGLFGLTVEGLAGAGIDGVHVEILVGKETQESVAACCFEGQCLGDVEQASCDFQGGRWHVDASCGADPLRPPPVCDHSPYLYNNGFPLDDDGAPVSQFAPDVPFAAAAADDFEIEPDEGEEFVRITSLWAWLTHSVGGIDPGVDYEGVTVTVYADTDPKGPAGRPEDDGDHEPTILRGIRYSQTIPIGSIGITSAGASCVEDNWKLEIPVDVLLTKGVKYWLEVQPVMPASRGHVRWLLSQNNNDHRAQRIGSFFGIPQWQEVDGNTNGCPDDTPEAGTHRNLAFQLFGTDLADPTNDDCADAITVTDGFMTFSTVGATTDGPEMPEDPPECQDFGYSHLESDVWFEYYASCSGDLTVSFCGSQFDTKMAIYDDCGSCPPRVDPVACNEDYCHVQSELTMQVVRDECYRIRLGGYEGAHGHGLMTISCYEPPPPTGACCDGGDCLGTWTEPACLAAGGEWHFGQNCQTFVCPVPPPPNDECYNCIPVITGSTYSGSTDGSSGTDVSSCGSMDSRDVWHCWTPNCTGSAIIGLCESDNLFDTSLAVYENCGGAELACSDNYCGPQSLKSLISPHQLPPVDVWVTAGETYYIRVSGRNGSVGDYNLAIDDCANACCSTTAGFCMLKTQEECLSVNGLPQGDGTACLGDHNGNRIDDACEGCPLATIVAALPPDGVIDARQHHDPGTVLPRQGIGSNDEAIIITLDPPVEDAQDCFVLCETVVDSILGPNHIDTVTHSGGGAYEIRLGRAITGGAVTTIQYLGDSSYVSYTSHPANVNGDTLSAPADILSIIDCLNAVGPPCEIYQCDTDRSGVCGPPDILRVIDLLNGAGEFDSWLNTPLPESPSCPLLRPMP